MGTLITISTIFFTYLDFLQREDETNLYKRLYVVPDRIQIDSTNMKFPIKIVNNLDYPYSFLIFTYSADSSIFFNTKFIDDSKIEKFSEEPTLVGIITYNNRTYTSTMNIGSISSNTTKTFYFEVKPIKNRIDSFITFSLEGSSTDPNLIIKVPMNGSEFPDTLNIF